VCRAHFRFEFQVSCGAVRNFSEDNDFFENLTVLVEIGIFGWTEKTAGILKFHYIMKAS